MILLVMGVSGVGKSTVGRALAARLGVAFVDADELHDPRDLAQMKVGVALTDLQRLPWIDRVHRRMLAADVTGETLVIACSALRAEHRRRLAVGIVDLRLVHLTADAEVVRRRLEGRQGGVGPALLTSQIEALEPPVEALVVSADRPLEELVGDILEQLEGA